MSEAATVDARRLGDAASREFAYGYHVEKLNLTPSNREALAGCGTAAVLKSVCNDVFRHLPSEQALRNCSADAERLERECAEKLGIGPLARHPCSIPNSDMLKIQTISITNKEAAQTGQHCEH